jgi:hypothetical protein
MLTVSQANIKLLLLISRMVPYEHSWSFIQLPEQLPPHRLLISVGKGLLDPQHPYARDRDKRYPQPVPGQGSAATGIASQ